MPSKHRPVRVEQNKVYIVCMCGWTSQTHKHLDDAWDEYDEHTMK